jgi:ubiquinone/menaquinone biosynthesis C-methylase UbiE
MIFGNLVDRAARRPSGILGYLLYRFPLGHKPGFNLVLDQLPPRAADSIAEIGCGGGVFMRRALKSGCRGLAVDHSLDMVANATRLNRSAVKSGRLAVLLGDAAQLPADDGSFDKAYCLNAFFFFPDPQKSIAEMARILKPGGRLALVTSPPEFERHIARFSRRMASSMRFDSLDTLDAWMKAAGLITEEMRTVPNAGNLVIARKETVT